MKPTITIVPAVVAMLVGVALGATVWFSRLGLARHLFLALVADAIFMVVFGILMLFEDPRALDSAKLPDPHAALRQGLRSLSTALLAAAAIGLVFGLGSSKG